MPRVSGKPCFYYVTLRVDGLSSDAYNAQSEHAQLNAAAGGTVTWDNDLYLYVRGKRPLGCTLT